MLADVHYILIGIAFFLLFVVLHVALFRFIKPELLFKGLIMSFGISFCACLGSCLLIFNAMAIGHLIISTVLVCLIFFLLASSYILCFFGPYETSIRMRLIREIGRGSGISLADLMARYNTAVILDNRLRRLLGSGDLVKKEHRYYIGKEFNVFFLIDYIALKMHAFIHSR